MLLVVLLLVSKAGAVCVGGLHELRTDEVMVMCSLSEDVRLSRRTVVISHLNHDQSIPDIMMGCDWETDHSHNPDCRSRLHFTLASLQKNCLMARVPRAQLHKNGSYQCQLVPPPDADHVFSRCLVYDNDDTEDHSTTISHVIPSTAGDLHHPRNDTEKVSTSADGGYPWGICDVALSVSVVILILVIAVIFYLYWIYRRMMQWTSNINLELNLLPRRMVSQTSDNSKKMEQLSRSATPERGRSKERPSPKELTGDQPRRDMTNPTNLTETKALLKMG